MAATPAPTTTTPRTVVVTGLGAVSPLGGDVASTWEAALAGRSGITTIEEDWAADLPVRFAGSVDVDVERAVPRVEARRMDRSSQLAVVAAKEAWEQSGRRFRQEYAEAGETLAEGHSAPDVPADRLGVCVATGIGGLHSLLSAWDTYKERGVRRVPPYTIPQLMANAPAAQVGLRVGAKAGVHTAVSACASSAEAVAQAIDLIRLGRADVVVAGGTEAVVHPLPLAAFAQMQALSRRNDDPAAASRPWDTSRDGFVLSEGAAVLVLEDLEHARARGARIIATLAGAGQSNDGHDIVQPDPSGAGQAAAMERALTESHLTPADIAHVNAHATSTPQGDLAESASIAACLGADSAAVVTGTKSMTGHLLGGAGAIEALFTVKAVAERISPPTINLTDPEPDLAVRIATEPTPLGDGDLAALSNSFGFGGANVTLAVTNEHAERAERA